MRDQASRAGICAGVALLTFVGLAILLGGNPGIAVLLFVLVLAMCCIAVNGARKGRW